MPHVVTEGVGTWDLLSGKALLSGFHARKLACPSSLWLLRWCSSKLVRTAVALSKFGRLRWGGESQGSVTGWVGLAVCGGNGIGGVGGRMGAGIVS